MLLAALAKIIVVIIMIIIKRRSGTICKEKKAEKQGGRDSLLRRKNCHAKRGGLTSKGPTIKFHGPDNVREYYVSLLVRLSNLCTRYKADSQLTFVPELLITSMILGVLILRLDFVCTNFARFCNPRMFVTHPLCHRASNNITNER